MKNKSSVYDETLRTYFELMDGCIVTLSKDQVFTNSLRLVQKTIGLPQNGFDYITDVRECIPVLKKKFDIYKKVILFVESSIDDKSTIHEIEKYKQIFDSNFYVICLSNESQKEVITYFYELGIDSIIVKPVSVNSIIEKIALTLKPNNRLSKHIEHAKKFIKKEKLKKASRYVDKILNEKPNSTIGFLLRGEIYELECNFEKAERYYRLAHTESILYIDPLKKLVSLYGKLERYKDKLEILNRLDNLSPLNVDRKLEIGNVHLQLKREESAFEAFDTAISLVKKASDSKINSVIRDISDIIKPYDSIKNIEFLEKIINNKKVLTLNDIWLFNEIGLLTRENKEYRKAEKYYKKALEISTNDGNIYYNLGIVYSLNKQYANSVKAFEHAIEYSPEIINVSANVCKNIASSYFETRNIEKAKEYVTIAKFMDENDVEVNRLYKKINEFNKKPKKHVKKEVKKSKYNMSF